MAVTITTDMTEISDCDATTGWSGGAVNATFNLEGSNCLGAKVSNNTSVVYAYTLAAAVDLTGKFAVMTMLITGKADTIAAGGYRIYFEDSSGNSKTFYVGGSDTHSGGWGYFAADPSQSAQASSGTLDITDILKIGVQMKTTTTAIGNTSNVFWDICHYGSYIGATSLTTDTITMADLASASDTNFYGLIQEIDGVYFCRGKIILGATATSHISFEDDGSAIVWVYDARLPNSSSGIEVLAGSTTTSDVTFKNGVIKGYVTKPSIDTTDVDINNFDLDTVLVQNFDGIDLEDNSTISGCILDGCEQIDLTDGTITNSVISSTAIDDVVTPEGSVAISDAASAALLSDMSFSGYANTTAYEYNDQFAIYVPATVTSFTMDNWQFDDPSNTNGYALYWAGTSGTLTISATNGTNLTNAGCTTDIQTHKTTSYDPFNDGDVIAQYPLDTNSNDDVGNYNGSDTSITYTTTGAKLGEGAIFNGSSSFIEMQGMSALSHTTVRAFSAWIKPDVLNIDQGIFSIQDSTNTWDWVNARIDNNGTLRIKLLAASGGQASGALLSTPFTAGSWTHIIVGWPSSSSSSGWTIYINGVLRTTTGSYTTTVTTSGGYGRLGLADDSVSTTQFFDGTMDHAMFYNRPLTSTEAKYIYETSVPTTSTGTITISQDVTVAVTNVVVGSTVHVVTVDANGDDSTVLINEVATGTTVSTSVNYAGLDYTSAIIRVRNSSGTPKYLPYRATGTISASGMSVTANQLKDTIAT